MCTQGSDSVANASCAERVNAKLLVEESAAAESALIKSTWMEISSPTPASMHGTTILGRDAIAAAPATAITHDSIDEPANHSMQSEDDVDTIERLVQAQQPFSAPESVVGVEAVTMVAQSIARPPAAPVVPTTIAAAPVSLLLLLVLVLLVVVLLLLLV